MGTLLQEVIVRIHLQSKQVGVLDFAVKVAKRDAIAQTHKVLRVHRRILGTVHGCSSVLIKNRIS